MIVTVDRSGARRLVPARTARARARCSICSPKQAYYSQPIALRHPIVFYEGHLPGFSFNTLVKKALGRPSIDARLEALFARGIDPHEYRSTPRAGWVARVGWGSGPCDERRGTRRGRVAVARRRSRVRRRSRSPGARRAVHTATSNRPGHPLLDRAEAVFTILEHEAMHQETLLYMWHRLPFDQKRRPAGYDTVYRRHAAAGRSGSTCRPGARRSA